MLGTIRIEEEERGLPLHLSHRGDFTRDGISLWHFTRVDGIWSPQSTFPWVSVERLGGVNLVVKSCLNGSMEPYFWYL